MKNYKIKIIIIFINNLIMKNNRYRNLNFHQHLNQKQILTNLIKI